MKKHTSSTVSRLTKKAAIALGIATCLFSMPAMAQRDHERGRGNEGSRPQITREPSIHQRQQSFPNNSNNSARFNNRNDQRVTADNFNRRSFDRSPSLPGNGEYRNRPNTVQDNVRRNDFNRGGNVYSRPSNSYNRPGYNNNRGRSYGYNSYNGGYNNNRRPVYSPYNPSWRYAYAPRRNSVFNTLPSFYLNLNFGGGHYRYYDGIYYRPYNNSFRVVAPPIGIFINTLPVGYRTIYVRDYPYYYYNGTYYDHRDDYYTVVSPPVGAVVESIPDGYKTLTIDGETYYEVDGAQYKPVVQENGEIWYEVIKSN